MVLVLCFWSFEIICSFLYLWCKALPLCCIVISLRVFMVLFLFASCLSFYVFSLGDCSGKEEILMELEESCVVLDR